MPLHVVFDTNVLYELSRLSKTERLRLSRAASSGAILAHYSPISVLELFSRLTKDPSVYNTLRSGASALISLDPTLLPDPESLIWSFVHGLDPPKENYSFLRLAVLALASSRRLQDLSTGVKDYPGRQTLTVDLTRIHELRNAYERRFAEDLLRVHKDLQDRFPHKRKAGRISNGGRTSLRESLADPAWHALFVAGLAIRAGRDPATLTSEDVQRITLRTEPFQTAYSNLLLALVCDGRSPVAHKNDCNDVHMLLHLQPPLHLVTSDKGLIRFSAHNRHSILTFSEFITQAAMF